MSTTFLFVTWFPVAMEGDEPISVSMTMTSNGCQGIISYSRAHPYSPKPWRTVVKMLVPRYLYETYKVETCGRRNASQAQRIARAVMSKM